MATTITVRTKGREGHFRYSALDEGVSTMEAAECECHATWRHSDDDSVLFADWAYNHDEPKIVRATVQCAGVLIRAEAVDGNGVGWCHKCERYRPTHPAQGYEGWFEFDPHPVFVAVKP